MSKNTSTNAPATVRMFDGTTWAEYKRGSKAHRKAEARRAAWEATRPTKVEKAKMRESNQKQAAWMRENAIVPSGSAWTLVKQGERSLKVLRAANAADGLTFKAPTGKKASAKKAGKKAAQQSAPVEAAVEVVTEETGSKAERKAAKRRSKAAKKAYRTRVANGTVARVNGRFVKAGLVADQTPAPEPKGDVAEQARSSKKALFWADLSDAGLTEQEIAAAWAVRKGANA